MTGAACVYAIKIAFIFNIGVHNVLYFYYCVFVTFSSF